MDTFEVTKDNKVKGYRSKEISIYKFIKLLKKQVNNSYITANNKLSLSIKYEASVYKYSDNIYKIILKNKKNPIENITPFLIDATNNQYLIEQLDILCEITAKHDFQSESYNKIEKTNFCSSKEKKAAIQFLNKLKNKHNKNKLILCAGVLASVLGGSTFVLSLTITVLQGLLTSVIAIPISLAATIVGMKMFGGKIDSHMPHLNKLIDNEIKRINDELTDSNGEQVTNNRNNMYMDSIINHMHSIMFIANKLNNDDKKNVLFELRTILGEYTKRSLDYSKIQDHVLSLENERKIALDIISKLSDLELRISIMMKNNNKEESLITDSEKLMEEINASLEVIDEEQTPEVGRVLTR